MLHGSETWSVRKENEVALQRAEMRLRMVRWMCNVKVKDRVPSKELRERLGIDDIILILQQNRLRWYGHVLRKEDTDWVKKCMEYEVESFRPRVRPKRTWKEVVQKDCLRFMLNAWLHERVINFRIIIIIINKEDAMDRGRWKKLIKIGWWSGWWVGECFFWYWLTRVVPDKGRKTVVVCVLFSRYSGYILQVRFRKFIISWCEISSGFCTPRIIETGLFYWLSHSKYQRDFFLWNTI